MSSVLNVLIVLLVLYLLKKAHYILHALWRKRYARDVEVRMEQYPTSLDGYVDLLVRAPFYDDDCSFAIGVGNRGIFVGFTPIRTLPRLVSEVFGDYTLVQVIVDDERLPSREYIHDAGLRPFEMGVNIVDGALVYNCDSLKSDALQAGMTLGVDAFVVVESPDSVRALVSSLPSKKAFSDDGEEAKEFLANNGVRGIILKRYEEWIFRLCDHGLIETLKEAVVETAFKKFFFLNDLPSEAQSAIPSREEIFPDIPSDYGGTVCLSIYPEGEEAVAFTRAGKKWNATTLPIAMTSVHRTPLSIAKKILRWVVPEVVGDRAYRSRSMFRYSVQYFITTACLTAVLFSIGLLPGMFLEGGLDLWIDLPELVLGLLWLLCLILAVLYLGRALSAGKGRVRSGIWA